MHYTKENDKRKRLIFYAFVFFLLLALLRIGTFKIPEGSFNASEKLPKKRGTVYDRYLRILASDVYVYDAYLDLRFLRTLHDTPPLSLSTLLENFSVNRKSSEVFYGHENFLFLGRFYDRDEIYRRVPPNLMKFISVHITTERKRIKDPPTSFIVGRVVDGKGISGIEKYMDEVLKESKDVTTSLDLDLQRRIWGILKKYVQIFKAKAAGFILMETMSGKIRAMVTTRNWNDTIMGIIEPGSSIKPVVYSIALETGSATQNFHHNCTGKIKPVKDLNLYIRDIRPHGEVDMKKALVVSCNTATVKIAQKIVKKIGKEGYYKWLKKFGFGEKTGVEISGEIGGILRSPERWSKIDFAEISIGQGIGVTPLQLLRALNVVFSGGFLIRPTVLENSTQSSKRIISEKTADFIKKALRDVVRYGTGELARVIGMDIMGKTGTAQKPPLSSKEKKYYSIFVGSFNLRGVQYSAIVYFDEPSSGKYLGGEVAAPVFAKIVTFLSNSQKEKPLVINDKVVPNLLGLSLKDLLYISSMTKFKIKIHGSGVVYTQCPKSGTISSENEIEVWLKSP